MWRSFKSSYKWKFKPIEYQFIGFVCLDPSKIDINQEIIIGWRRYGN